MMYDINFSQRTIGVNFNSAGNAEIVVWSPLRNKVNLVTEKKIQIPLDKDSYGYWKGVTPILKPSDRYKFLLDDENLFPDPASLSQPEGPHNYSEAIRLTDFAWNDHEWKNIPLKDYIIYELHAGTFSETGNFNGIISKLDYLSDLGITAIEIMPVAQFSGERNWGYDGVFPFAVHNSYGGAGELQRLVNMCHSKGLAVILDVVYNHLGPEGNYLSEFGPYLTDNYKTLWGKAVNFDDEWCDGVRKYFIENTLMWLRDFHFDALRFDAIHAIKDFSSKHILTDIKLHVQELSAITGKQYHLIIESDLNDTKFIESTAIGGSGMDAQWLDDFHHALHVTTTGEKEGYYADYNGIGDLCKSFNSAFVYDGVYSRFRKKTFGTSAKGFEPHRFIIFSQNHDQVGNRQKGERIGHLVSFELQKLICGAVMFSPFVPLIFMGEEWNASSPFQYFVSHIDSELAEAVRKGRSQEFKFSNPMEETPDPLSIRTFHDSKLNWTDLERSEHKIIHDFYKHLIGFHKYLNSDNNNEQFAHASSDANRKILKVKRNTQELVFTAVMNFSEVMHHLIHDEDCQKVIINSADSKWKENSGANRPDDRLLIAPESIIIYSNSLV
jgi:maltooligosyltrehalose trehalohydrolase